MMAWYFITQFLRRFIMNESALCYRRMYVCMHETKSIVTKLQMLQTSPLAQIDLLTIEIDLPSDTEKFAILAGGGHLEFPKANSRPASFCSELNSLEFWLHLSLATPHFIFPSIKW
jgi:hypothetical protein